MTGGFGEAISGKKLLYILLGMWAKLIRPLIYDPFDRFPEYFENYFKYMEKFIHAIVDKIRKTY